MSLESVDGAAHIRALGEALGPEWSGIAERLDTGGAHQRSLGPASLARPAVLRECFARFDRAHPDRDPRALASLWTQWYAATAWPGLVAGAVLLGRAPRIDEAPIRLDEDARPVGVGIGRVEAVETGAFIEALARRQAAPLMAAATETGLAERVPWSNAINVLGWILDQLGPLADAQRLEAGYAVFERPRWRDGTANPLAAARQAGGGRPPRRVCCLRYRLAGFDYCGDCPIPDARR